MPTIGHHIRVARPTAQQTFLVFQNVVKTSWRRLQRNNLSFSKTSSKVVIKTFWRRLSSRPLLKTSSECFQDIFKTCSKTSSRHVCKTSSSRRLQENVLQLYLGEVLEDKKQLHWRRLSTSSPRRMFAGRVLALYNHPVVT